MTTLFTTVLECTPSTYFLRLTAKQPQEGPRGGIEEEGIVTTGGDNSIWVIALEQDVEVEDLDIDDPDPV